MYVCQGSYFKDVWARVRATVAPSLALTHRSNLVGLKGQPFFSTSSSHTITSPLQLDSLRNMLPPAMLFAVFASVVNVALNSGGSYGTPSTKEYDNIRLDRATAIAVMTGAFSLVAYSPIVSNSALGPFSAPNGRRSLLPSSKNTLVLSFSKAVPTGASGTSNQGKPPTSTSSSNPPAHRYNLRRGSRRALDPTGGGSPPGDAPGGPPNAQPGSVPAQPHPKRRHNARKQKSGASPPPPPPPPPPFSTTSGLEDGNPHSKTFPGVWKAVLLLVIFFKTLQDKERGSRSRSYDCAVTREAMRPTIQNTSVNMSPRPPYLSPGPCNDVCPYSDSKDEYCGDIYLSDFTADRVDTLTERAARLWVNFHPSSKLASIFYGYMLLVLPDIVAIFIVLFEGFKSLWWAAFLRGQKDKEMVLFDTVANISVDLEATASLSEPESSLFLCDEEIFEVDPSPLATVISKTSPVSTLSISPAQDSVRLFEPRAGYRRRRPHRRRSKKRADSGNISGDGDDGPEGGPTSGW
ncbi:hypothetical protein GALMADRAFT_227556 [Galerina marginata CBS 339.88]|uniref:Uncharacterized protein n=1 Tax=Galerina marginata (strain CBS 339.88) TaxID=685588 RepID=A0A067T690_GALM3|nr:hypothetical protein GALMADRAFT_227556 [Galerina marginata CBS 339.88]